MIECVHARIFSSNLSFIDCLIEKRIVTFNRNWRNLISKKQERILNILGIDFILKYHDWIFWFYSFCFIYPYTNNLRTMKDHSLIHIFLYKLVDKQALHCNQTGEDEYLFRKHWIPPFHNSGNIIMRNFTSHKSLVQINSERNFRYSKYMKMCFTPSSNPFISKSVKFSVTPPCKIRSFVK